MGGGTNRGGDILNKSMLFVKILESI